MTGSELRELAANLGAATNDQVLAVYDEAASTWNLPLAALAITECKKRRLKYKGRAAGRTTLRDAKKEAI